jgi:hypothetical protein
MVLEYMDIERTERVLQYAIDLNLKDAFVCVLLSNIYEQCGNRKKKEVSK